MTLTLQMGLENWENVELNNGFGFYHSKPTTSFSPVCVTPDSPGDAWDGTKLHGAVDVSINGQKLGNPGASTDMSFDFAQVIEHATKTRTLSIGNIIASGTISNEDRSGEPGCRIEVRTIQTIETSTPEAPNMLFGEKV